jgi:hypothetical protein
MNNAPLVETMVRTYRSEKQMQSDQKYLARAGWQVRSIAQHREQKGSMTCGIILLAILTFGVALLLLLAARRTVYTVTYERPIPQPRSINQALAARKGAQA